MKVNPLDNFLFITPQKPQSIITVNLKQHDVYRLKNPDIYSPIMRVDESTIFPLFLYDLYFPSMKKKYEQSSIFIPVNIDYVKEETKRKLKIRELWGNQLNLRINNVSHSAFVKNICSFDLKEKNINNDKTLFEVEIYIDKKKYILEKIYSKEFKIFFLNSIKILYPEERDNSLSIKNILDPDGGIDRLLDHIGQFPYAKNLEKLIQIIRSGTDEEERKIYNALKQSDPSFYMFIKEKIFNDDLIPFMNKKEIFLILSKVHDELIAEIYTLPIHKQKEFMKCISKNRLANAKIYFEQNELKTRTHSNELWKTIINYYKENYSTVKIIKNSDRKMDENFEKICPGNDKSTFRKIDYLQSNSPFYILGFCKNFILFELKEKCNTLQIYNEIHRFEYEESIFTNLIPGYYALSLEKIPDHVFVAGFNDKKEIWSYKGFRV